MLTTQRTFTVTEEKLKELLRKVTPMSSTYKEEFGCCILSEYCDITFIDDGKPWARQKPELVAGSENFMYGYMSRIQALYLEHPDKHNPTRLHASRIDSDEDFTVVLEWVVLSDVIIKDENVVDVGLDEPEPTQRLLVSPAFNDVLGVALEPFSELESLLIKVVQEYKPSTPVVVEA